jgi:hypothetical protein
VQVASGGPASHAQPGDPVKGVQAIVDAVDGGAVPVRVFPGSDTIARVSQKRDRAGTFRIWGSLSFFRPPLAG